LRYPRWWRSPNHNIDYRCPYACGAYRVTGNGKSRWKAIAPLLNQVGRGDDKWVERTAAINLVIGALIANGTLVPSSKTRRPTASRSGLFVCVRYQSRRRVLASRKAEF
jgi:hypothetical protein